MAPKSIGPEAHLLLAGNAPDANHVSGTITVPEVAHDTEESEYVVCSLLASPRCDISLLMPMLLSLR
jgi:hypothetical protein